MLKGNIEETLEPTKDWETPSATDNNVSRMVTLVSKDDCKYTLTVSAAIVSEFVKNAVLNEVGGEGDEAADEASPSALPPQEVTVLNVMGKCLAKVVQFLNHYQEESFTVVLPILKNSFDECVTQKWYREFINDMDQDMVHQVLGAANYMDIKPLLELACLRVTFYLSDKTAEEIQDLLFPPAPEEKDKTQEEIAEILATRMKLTPDEYAFVFNEDNHTRTEGATNSAEVENVEST